MNKHQHSRTTSKQRRAFAYLTLRNFMDVKTMAVMLRKPLSTMQKPDNAYKRLTGKLGSRAQREAITALALVDMGFKQTQAVQPYTDHKMVSDLVAMRWAMGKYIADQANYAQSYEQEIVRTTKARLRQHIDAINDAFDMTLGAAPADEEALTVALEDLLAAIQRMQEALN